MPHTINGCGTRYYGKDNVISRNSVCGACKNSAVLTSYDTTLFAVVLFVPIVPLRKLRVVDQCSRCRRHNVIRWADWNEAQQRAEDSVTAYRLAPSNADLAEQAIRLAVANRDIPAFKSLASEIERNLPGNAKAMMMLSSVFNMFGYPGDTERVLRKAVSSDSSPEVREALAQCLANLGRPEEAEPLLRHIVEQAIPDRIALLVELAQSYQAKANHQKALEIYAACETINPLIGDNPTFARLRDASRELLGTQKPLHPGKLIQQDRKRATRKRELIGLAVVAAVACSGYLAVAGFQGMNQTIYIVSGVDRGYNAKIDGKTYWLSPGAVQKIRVPQGDVDVQVVDSKVALPSKSFNIRTPLLTRPFNHHTYVINPDGAAIIQRADITYAPRGTAPVPHHNSFYAGQGFWDFNEIDYPFQQPPPSLQVDANAGPIVRKALSLLESDRNVRPASLLMLMSNKIGKSTAANIAWQRFLFSPESTGYLDAVRQVMPPAQAVEKLHALLSAPPFNIELHRAYQDMLLQTQQDDRATREYSGMLAADPSNPELLYLMSRVTHDTQKSRSLLLQAAQAPAPSAYALYALSGLEESNGNFEQAAAYGKRAAELMPDNNEIHFLAYDVMLAANDSSDLLKVLEEDSKKDYPAFITALPELAYLHSIDRHPERSRMDVLRLQSRLVQSSFSDSWIDQFVEGVRAQCDYAQGNLNHLIQCGQRSADPSCQFAGLLTAGHLDQALALCKNHESSEAYLTLYLAAYGSSRGDIAQQARHRAALLMSKGLFEERAFGLALEDKAQMPIEELLNVRLPAKQKLLAITVLGLHDPRVRPQCFELARKLNFDRRFPYWLLRASLKAKMGR